MSDDLVVRLRRSRTVWVNGAQAIIDVDSAYKDFHDAADRIEALEAERDELRAERDTLAEMVRLLDRIAQVRAEAGHDRLVADDAEYERCSPSCRRPAGHAGPHSDLPREGER